MMSFGANEVANTSGGPPQRCDRFTLVVAENSGATRTTDTIDTSLQRREGIPVVNSETKRSAVNPPVDTSISFGARRFANASQYQPQRREETSVENSGAGTSTDAILASLQQREHTTPADISEFRGQSAMARLGRQRTTRHLNAIPTCPLPTFFSGTKRWMNAS